MRSLKQDCLRAKKYYWANRAKVLERRKRWYKENSATDKARSKLWRVNNKERHRLTVKKWLRKNKDHHLEWCRKWYQKNRILILKRGRDYYKKCRLEMMTAYGGKCACCSEETLEFLTLEHINHDGKMHRKQFPGQGYVLDLKRRGWPTDGYTILCFNCNMARKDRKQCPHKIMYQIKEQVNEK